MSSLYISEVVPIFTCSMYCFFSAFRFDMHYNIKNVGCSLHSKKGVCFVVLTFCSLSENKISVEGARELARALQVNQSLQELK